MTVLAKHAPPTMPILAQPMALHLVNAQHGKSKIFFADMWATQRDKDLAKLLIDGLKKRESNEKIDLMIRALRWYTWQ